jgi:Domain of unknown function (DUF3883)
VAATGQFRRQAVDFLGFLANKLRDLQGFGTVVNELLQNADDAPGVTMISFDVRDDALVVINNGSFRDDDFENLANPSSRGKRDEADTTGAFGIGLIALYQLCDSMELRSAGQHWIIRPDRPEDKRIEYEQIAPTDNTTFRFPWAFEPGSPVREALDLEALSPDDPPRFADDLQDLLPVAALFLRKVDDLVVKRNGRSKVAVARVKTDDEAVLQVNGTTSAWRLLHGSFEHEAEGLRARVGPRIPDKYQANVSIAVRESADEHGLIYAWLPTQQSTGLPIHINADFFTTSDRKRIVLEDDFKSQWNRLAISAAAETLSRSLEILREHFGHKQLWALVYETQQLSSTAASDEIDSVFGSFWDSVRPELSDQELIYTTRGTWCHPDEAFFLMTPGHEKHVSLLEKLSIQVVHSDLRPMYTFMTGGDVGVGVLNSERLAGTLRDAGFDDEAKSVQDTLLPSKKALKELWELIDSTVRLDEQQNRPQAGRHFSSTAVSISRQGGLHLPERLYRADAATLRLFAKLGSDIEFLDDLGMPESALAKLSPAFSVEEAVDLLEDIDPQLLISSMHAGSWTPKAMLRWFEERRDELLDNDDLRERFRGLPIWPAGDHLKPLSELALPGTFEDPLHLTDLVDLSVLGGRKEFLKDVGVQELSLEVYAREHIPAAIEDDDLPVKVRRQVVALLAANYGVLSDHDDIRDALARCDLVECDDGAFRLASEVYFKSKEMSEALGDYVHYAKGSTAIRGGKRSLYTWLGVHVTPRAGDVCGRIESIVDKAPTKQRVATVVKVFRYLGHNWSTLGKHAEQYAHLRLISWLPGTRDASSWFSPEDVFAVYQRYLFATQGNFLAMPQPDQNAGRDFMEFLQVQLSPTVQLVVRHLLLCAQTGETVNEQVYQFLDRNSDDASIAELEGENCIHLKDVGYVRPNQVFWRHHPFGRFRYQLGDSLIQYRTFFTAIGVREDPEATDAIDVLGDIREEFGNGRLDEETRDIVSECWRVLTDGLAAEEVDDDAISALSSKKCIVNAQQVFQEPRYMFLDDRPGLVQRFPYLANDLVRRVQGVWPAMAAAGVQRLSQAVERRLVECADPAEDEALRERVRSRRLHIARVLESHREQLGEFDSSAIDAIFYFRTDDLNVQYVLHYFGRKVPADPEPASAFFDSEHNSLYYVPKDSAPQWASVARELTYALQPDQDASNVVPALKDVLAAETPEDAQAVLDEFGYPPLEEQSWTTHEGEVHGELGAEDTGEDFTEAEGEYADEAEVSTGGLSAEDAVKALLGAGAPEPEPPPDDTEVEQEPTGAGAGKSSTGGGSVSPNGRAPKKRGRLRSYVITGDDSGSGDEEEDDEPEPENEADPKGVERVVLYEISQGRRPKVMPHTNPGYDIESSSAEDKIERYIEVKSLTGEWVEFGAGMTRPQFKKAQELREQFWLYVVECATDDDACAIYCIQDPARKVDQFMYDDEWKKTAKAVWRADTPEGVVSDG